MKTSASDVYQQQESDLTAIISDIYEEVYEQQIK